jgi:glutathione S-transferase
MTGKPVLYGADYSVYVRIVRLALEEKGVGYDLMPIDAFAADGPGEDYLRRHPFGRIPAFEHEDFHLYETGAIARYVDEAFQGPRLQPAGPKERARMNQIVSIADSYLYRTLVWDVYVERVNKPERGEIPDEARIAAALARAETAFKAVADLMANGPWMVGNALSLADLWLAPMIDYFLMTPEGRTVAKKHPELMMWWAQMTERPSMLTTKYTL